MEQIRKQQLYQVFEEAKTRKVHVDDWIFREGFNTILYDLEGKVLKEYVDDDNPITLQIRDVSKFEEKMDTYVDEMSLFLKEHPLFYAYDNVYFDGKKEFQEKYMMTSIWSNATISDFENPLSFLDRRIGFLKDKTVEEEKFEADVSPIFQQDDVKLIYGVEAEHPNMETPYHFIARLENKENESYMLPSISFGIHEGKCYIYAIQDKEDHKRKDTFYKKIKRNLYHANKDIEDDYYAEKITDVSPAQVCSLALFLGYMNRMEITNYEAVSYLPMRYQAKDLILLEKYKKMEALLMNLEEPIKTKMLDEMEEAFLYAEKLQENITNKFTRNFLRIQKHFEGIDITSYPGEVDFSLHFKTNKDLKPKEDAFIKELYQTTNRKESSNKSI